MSEADDMPVPGLEQAFTFELDFAPALEIGRLATGGVRAVHPVTGGTMQGLGLAGTVIGGSETLLSRKDGITVVEAAYLVAMADGGVIRVLGTGYLTQDAGFDGMRLSLAFEADEGAPQAWLATRAFIGERPAGSAILDIAQIV